MPVQLNTSDGRIRNKPDPHCNDVGDTNWCRTRTEVVHNTLHAMLGTDARFPDTDAVFTNNLVRRSRIGPGDGGR